MIQILKEMAGLNQGMTPLALSAYREGFHRRIYNIHPDLFKNTTFTLFIFSNHLGSFITKFLIVARNEL